VNNLPQPVLDGVQNMLLKKHGNRDVPIGFSAIGGGCINHGGKLSHPNGDLFLKWNQAKKFPHMFQTEALGLKLLSSAGGIRIPEVVGVGEGSTYQYILMEFIGSRSHRADYWDLLGQQLAEVHKKQETLYGLDHHNYMGSLHQFNHRNSSWSEFFIKERLQVQVKLGRDSGAISPSIARKFESLYQALPSILFEEPPCLVHGDLWSGNLITDDKGEPCLIDPAAYYGHREVDLAMTQLFGGFNDRFYDIYQEVFPLEPGFQERLHIYNLYPLLVHVNLFGNSYLHQVNSILKAFA
jgi:protein-ribulosamine 3-kinase